MIKDKIVVKRYAEAFISFLKETIGIDKGVQELKNLKDMVMRPCPEFLQFLESFDITYAEKSDFIDSILKDSFSQELREFLRLLVRKERINELPDIMEYIRITYSQLGEALLKTSFPLDLDMVKAIEDKLERKFNKKFKFYIDLDGALMGGIQIVIGNKVIDGSVRKRVDELKEKLMAIKV